jgi:DNA invertase Pin-like site-specific DNA recombinase
MANGKFISYLRVSTQQQGNSGLGLEAQREAVSRYLNGGQWTLVQELVEIESGKRKDRPKLAEALALCRIYNATLIIGKLDRLARDTEFLLSVVRESGEGGVVFCDLPTIPAGPVGIFMVTQMAAVAALEAGLISQRTKAALAAAKARGVQLGGIRGGVERMAGISRDGNVASASVRTAAAAQRNERLAPVIASIQGEGKTTPQQIADALNEKGISAPRGGAWSPVQVRRILIRTKTPHKASAATVQQSEEVAA